MVKVCHNGRVLEMEQAALRAHLDHGDFEVGDDLERGDVCTRGDSSGDEIVVDDQDQVLEDVTFVKVCHEGTVDELTSDQVETLSDHIDTSISVEDLELGEGCGPTFVEVCHEGQVLEIEEHALDGHLGHGDVLLTGDETCDETVLDDDVIVDGPGGGDPVIVDVEVESGADEDDGQSTPEPKPAPIISTITVERPTPAVPAVPATPVTPQSPVTPAAPATPAVVTDVPATPAAPAAAEPITSSRNEVLGSITTRTPSGATVTALAATGTSTTVALAAIGTVLLLAGLGLQVTARRRVRATDVGA